MVSKEIKNLDKYRCMQPLRDLAEVLFRGLYGNFFIIFVTLSRKFYKVLSSPGRYRFQSGQKVFEGGEVCRTFLRFCNLRPRLFRFLASYRTQFYRKMFVVERHLDPRNF